MIDPRYLPFTREELKPHFTADADRNIRYFETSAQRYKEFMSGHATTAGISLREAKVPRQIEKDERFWTVTCLKRLYDHPDRSKLLEDLLVTAFGSEPPLHDFTRWDECLDGPLDLFFEAQTPSPQSYVRWLADHLQEHQMIPYILDAAERKSARVLEGATHVDAVFLNQKNGFALLVEAKVLSDVAYGVSFDNYRNQLIRNIDVMIEPYPTLRSLAKRRPDRSLFALLTPERFREHPTSRLYGWLLREYQSHPPALARDLPHRGSVNWSAVSSRLGWITFEEVDKICPGACPWFNDRA